MPTGIAPSDAVLHEHASEHARGAISLTTFRDLGALPAICDALDRVNITEPFPIQAMTLPVALTGNDLIGQARTGTGKTLGFGIPLLQRCVAESDPDYAELVAPGKPQALVVTPTRELAVQVAGDLKTASTVRAMRILTIYGGVAYEPQLDTLEAGVDVVVGTPGRLLDLAQRRALDLSHVKVLVLDEADEMLDLGFLPDVEKILAKTPELRQTMLFSATMPSAVVGLARMHMRHPLNIRAESSGESEMVPATAQFVYRAHDLDKPEIVARILQSEDRGKTIIFCRTKRAADRLTDDLRERGFSAAAIHGDLTQVAREKALNNFREGKDVDVLIATDVAARGIDVADVTHVINYACPEDEKPYVHRIGRTGRAGATGIAITFVDWQDMVRWKAINNALNLPYPEPQEIYSTSPELYHDLGIPTDATGRVGEALSPRPGRRTDRDGDRPGRGGQSAGGRGRGRSDAGGRRGGGDGRSNGRTDARTEHTEESRPRRSRDRRRTRNGEPVAGDAGGNQAPASVSSDGDGSAPRRRRRRSRGRSGGAGENGAGGNQADRGDRSPATAGTGDTSA